MGSSPISVDFLFTFCLSHFVDTFESLTAFAVLELKTIANKSFLSDAKDS